MDAMKLEILELLIRLAVLIMAGIVVPAFKKWLDTRTENEQIEKVHSWVYAAVGAAEQIYNHAEKLDPDGSKRKKYVHNSVMRICINNKILITDRELDILIEAAVNTLNSIHVADNDTAGGEEDGESEEDS